MSLELLINTYSKEEYDLGDNAVVAAKLNAPSIVISDDELYTWAGIALVAGPEAAEMLRVALEQNNMGWAVHQFGGSGLQLTNPLVRGALEQFILAGVPLQSLLDATQYNISPAQKLIGREVTEEEVFNYRLARRKTQLNADAKTYFNDKIRLYHKAIALWDGLTDEPQFTDV